jgi:hypothetical protein
MVKQKSVKSDRKEKPAGEAVPKLIPAGKGNRKAPREDKLAGESIGERFANLMLRFESRAKLKGDEKSRPKWRQTPYCVY